MACDPKKSIYTDLSPYQFCGNNPIIFTDSNGEIIVDPKNDKQVVKVDGQWKTIEGTDGNGNYIYGDVSRSFTKRSQPTLDLMTSTETGKEIYNQMQLHPTKIAIDSKDRSNISYIMEVDASSAWNTPTGAKVPNSATGLYDKVIVTPALENIQVDADNSGVDFMEKFLQVMSVEFGHFSSSAQVAKENSYNEQIETSESYNDTYRGLMQGAVEIGKKYRTEVNKPIDEKSDIPMKKHEEKVKTLKDSNNRQ